MGREREHKTKFLNTFFKDRKQIGALTPSSRYLVKKMCDQINFDTANVIVELGPGTGVFTKEIIKRAGKNTKIFVIELNKAFYDLLKTKYTDPRVVIINSSADKIDEILKEYSIQSVDAIISSLPLTVIPEKVKKKIIIKSHHSLKIGGIFVQYQYSLNAKKLLELKFGKLKLGFVALNIPPAFVYLCIK